MSKILTIIVPSYNMEAYLPKCLGSLLIDDKELLQKLEVIVVNDGSKDCTSEIAHKFEKKYPGVFRVIDKNNGNYGSCINRGLKEAVGIYIKTLDADDWFETSSFERYLAFIERFVASDNLPDLILNDFDFVDCNANVLRHYSYAFVKETGFTVAGFTYALDRALWMHGVAYKTQRLRDIHYVQMEGVSYTDEEWISQPVITVSSIEYFPGTVYKYLNGRQGQTCEPSEYARSFWMQIKILKKLLGQYALQEGKLPLDNEQYMRNHLSYRIGLTYGNLLLNPKVSLSDRDVLDFDLFLKDTIPSLYEVAEQFVVSNTVKFHYVREWRKRQTRNTFKYKLYSCFVLIRSAINLMRRHIG